METETKRRRKRRRLNEDESEFLLPPEIITEILYRLPADSAIGCRGICKQWRSLIDHPSFRDTHTRRFISSSSSTTSNSERFGGNYSIPNSSSSFGHFLYALQEEDTFRLQFIEYNDNVDDDDKLFPEFKPSKKPITGPRHFPFYLKWGFLLMSSCNGLVFMGSTKPNYVNDMFVCNPFTREYMNLRTKSNTPTPSPSPTKEEEDEMGRMAYGFGYIPSTNEYKVVSIYYNDGLQEGKVSVYTLGSSGRWRNKGEIPYWLYNESHPGVLANGAIHWFTRTKKEIVSFDLTDEEFRVVLPLPPPAPSAFHADRLGVLGGCLCVTRTDMTRRASPQDIWVLNVHTKEEEGKEEFSWNKRFSIPWKETSFRNKPYVILKSGKILLWGGTGLICYDPKTEAFNKDRQSIFYNPGLKVIPYTKSFVSLKALGEEDAKCFKRFVSLAPYQPPQPLSRNKSFYALKRIGNMSYAGEAFKSLEIEECGLGT